MLYPNGTLQHTARKFRTIKWEFLDLFRFGLFILPYKKRAQLMLGKYFKSDFNFSSIFDLRGVLDFGLSYFSFFTFSLRTFCYPYNFPELTGLFFGDFIYSAFILNLINKNIIWIFSQFLFHFY